MVGPVDEELEPYQLQRYFLLDLRRLGVEDAMPDNVLYAQALVEQGRWEDLRPALSALQEATDPEADVQLRSLFAALVRQAAEGSGQVSGETLKKLKSFEETGELGEMGSLLAKRMDQAVDESRAEGRELGLTEGREQGLERQRAILLRLAARKFDAGTATRLEALLAAIDDPDRLAVLGDHVIDSDDGEELLSRVTGALRLH